MYTSTSQIFDDPLYEYVVTSECADDFIDKMNCLYLLSFLVTADRQLAETCFSDALQEYMEAQGGFMEWAKQEGRRAIIRNAVQAMRPAPKQAYSWSFHTTPRSLVSAAHQPFAAITSLSAFERFVFVMSVIEGFSEEDCAALLNCSLQDVAIGRELAEKIIAAEDLGSDLTGEMGLYCVPSLLGHQRCGIC